MREPQDVVSYLTEKNSIAEKFQADEQNIRLNKKIYVGQLETEMRGKDDARTRKQKLLAVEVECLDALERNAEEGLHKPRDELVERWKLKLYRDEYLVDQVGGRITGREQGD